MTSVENTDPEDAAAIHFIQTASLHIGCSSPGIRPIPGKQTHPFVPSRRTVPSTSMIVAPSVMSDGAAVIARAILSSAVSALDTVAAQAMEIARMAVKERPLVQFGLFNISVSPLRHFRMINICQTVVKCA